MITAGNKDLCSFTIYDDMSRRNIIRKRDTWQSMEHVGSGDGKGIQSFHNPTKISNRSIYADLTCKLHEDNRSHTSNLPGIHYLITLICQTKNIVSAHSRTEPPHSANSAQDKARQVRNSMAGEGSCNRSANNDLQQAREIYKRRTSQRNKRRIIDLEATVQEEESKLSDQQIGKDVDWL